VTNVLRAEWTKLRTLRSTTWSMLFVIGLTVGLGAVFAAGSESTAGAGSKTPATFAGDNDIVRDSLVGVYLGQFAVIAFATLAITSEYATKTILATFSATPRRGRVLVAKALLVSGTVLVAGLVASTTAFLLGQRLLRDSGYAPPGYPHWDLGDGPAQRAVIGTALFLAGLALLSLGLGAILRHSAATISTLLALLFVPLIVAPLLPDQTREIVQKATPGAGLAVQQTIARDDALPIGPWAGLAVTFTWAAAAFLLALLLIRRRDA
jgi:ABC-2 type transport system permease protein